MTLYDLIEAALRCQQVRADGTLVPLLAQSRRAPMRSAVKRYAAMLGLDPHTALAEDAHLPDHEIRALIVAKAPDMLAGTTVRNLINDVISLLRLAVEQGWLQPLPAPLLSWRQRRRHKGSYIPRDENPPFLRYGLDLAECPPALRDELTAYVRWCEAPLARNRDRRVAKRPVTSQKTYTTILRLAGFSVRHLHLPVESLTLRGLCQPDVIEAYVNWWLSERCGRVTAGLEQFLLIPKTIARHWLKDPELTATLAQIMRCLPPTEPVRDKQARWLTLAQLEEIGLSLHPLNARRLHDFPILRQPHYHRRRSRRRTALYVGFSLIIRLLIRLPMRQRCIREMALGKHLAQDHAGVWWVRFVGSELKVAQVKGVLNRYEFPFPVDLVPLLEEYLREWRPRLASPGEAHVFLNSMGKPFTEGKHVSDMIARTTWRFTGVGVTPHMIRDIWATEYLDANPGDVGGCARRLGNRPETVMAHYAHILKKSADARAEAFLQATFANGTSP